MKVSKIIIFLMIFIFIPSVMSLSDGNPSNNLKTITINVVETKKSSSGGN